MQLRTPHLHLVLKSVEQTRAWIENLPPQVRRELSAAWLAQVEGAAEADPWIHGFTIIRCDDSARVGECGFKGPPNAEGMVEIAYGIEPEHQGRGYATEAAAALVAYAFNQPNVRLVRAHTLPEANASTRVLTKCGFVHLGEVVDPEDGLVWRWERVG
jgi:[ribosomal protein S5]-alanine N-acetyltransferase